MPPIPAIILAAGLSSRMHPHFKPLLPLAGRPLIAHVVQTLAQTPDLHPILLITGHRADEVAAAAGGSNVTPIFNPHYESGGMLSSLQHALPSLPPNSQCFLLSLADQPTLLPQTLTRLIQAWHASPTSLVMPTHQGKRGHPLILPASTIPPILALRPPQTLKTVTQQFAPQTLELPTDDPGTITDIDTPEDYQQLLATWPDPRPQ